MTNESTTIAAQLDSFPEQVRQEILETTLVLMGVYRDEQNAAGGSAPQSEPKRRPFKRRATHPRKAEVISLDDRRARMDRSA